jgi:DNA-binding GntR family transcriptional regulator
VITKRGNGTDAVDGVAYQELARSLREAIAAGEFTDGKRLPTEVELAAVNSLSRQTVRRALQELVSEGLVYRVRGRGTFATGVSPGNRYLRSFGSVEDLLAYSFDTTLETVAPLTRRADIDIASRLRLSSDDVIVALVRRFNSGAPFCATRLAFSIEIGTQLAAEGLLDRAGQTSSVTAISAVDRISAIAGAHQSITVVALDEEIATQIEVEPGSWALRIDRLYYDTRSRPVELATSYFNPDRYTYRVELSRGPRSR